ncbi:hypothetical protein Tco_0021053 [Tanacetum coccineum]
MKNKLALLKANPPTSQPSKPFQSKYKGLIAETFNWDEEEVSDEEETMVQVLMALADDEISASPDDSLGVVRRLSDSAANKEEPVRRGPEARVPGSTLRRSSQNSISMLYKDVVENNLSR